ncbi:MAG: branched-chain amino acid ABC transporter permease [Deltaproteobacteria bacterium]|nr:branched-chain amino acid ABC transporter permease [Deltaproteobacteria bacterium]MBW2342938.1 branched-chain amino acid ABC transporter permease [Deltaproteobacteria bacterium]
MEFLMRAVVDGVVIGSIYAIVALGFVLIFKSSGVLNFAQGELLVVGAYIAYLFINELGLGLGVSFLITFVITALLGILINFSLFYKMIGESVFSLVMVTVGLSYLLKCCVQLIWGMRSRVFPPLFTGPHIDIMDTAISRDSAATVIFAILFLAIFVCFFNYTKFGTAMRATANDQVAAIGCGVEVKTIFAAAWAISFVVSSVGGVIMAGVYGLNSNLASVGIRVFPVVILGGLDSVAGAVVGGYIIGLVESLSQAYLGQYFSTDLEIISFVILMAILIVKPYGLFGTVRIERL